MASTLLGTLLAAAFSLLTTPVYTAQTQLFVAMQSAGSVAELQQGNTFTQARVQSYVETVKTPAVLQPVIDELGLDQTLDELAAAVEGHADLNTVLLTISATNPSSPRAAAIAQSVADSLIVVVSQLESPGTASESPVKLSVVKPAVPPMAPSTPNTPLNLFLGIMLGLVAGIGWSFLRAAIDTRIRGSEDLKNATDSPVLGGVSYDSDVAKKPLLTQIEPQSVRAESFRQIRTNLQFANINSASKTLLITSSVPGEGKSTTATNTAIAMSQSGLKVVLVDADLRRPTVAEYLGLEGNAGLTTALVGEATVHDLLQPWGNEGMHVLTSGRIPPNPSELLGSASMSKLLTTLEEEFDVVIIDAPPLIPVTDASVLAQRVGGVLLVVGAGKLRTQDLQKSIASLDFVGANVLGMVLNLLPTKGPDAYAYSYYSYEANSSTPSGSRVAARQQASVSGTRSLRRSRDVSHMSDGFDKIIADKR